MDRIALGTFIRTRREALQPEDVGLRRRSRRRTAGLRCEEVADLSDMFADYLARLERGAGPQPSTQMIGALARRLRLTIDERDHLLLLAGHVVPARGGSGGHVSPGLMRILDRLADTPAQVVGPLGETLAQNTAGHRPLRGRVPLYRSRPVGRLPLVRRPVLAPVWLVTIARDGGQPAGGHVFFLVRDAGPGRSGGQCVRAVDRSRGV